LGTARFGVHQWGSPMGFNSIVEIKSSV
jgi:hypothetical protein